MIYGGHFDTESKLKKIEELENITYQPDFWDDKDNADKIFRELNELKGVTSGITNIKEQIDNDIELIILMDSEEDPEIINSLNIDLDNLKEEYEKLSVLLLLDGDYDKSNCILEVHAGAGGTEACDWANMLYRMYLRYIEKHGFKYQLLDYQEGDTVGIKSVSIKVEGLNAYGYLKCEKGVHRLVRLSPFDTANKRHTSFASIDIIPEFDDNIDINIDEKDIRVDVFRSSGCGGQGVNTTDSAVRITHFPSKIVVTCQNERSQIQNKEECMKMLKNKLYMLELEKKNKELSNIQGDYVNIEFGSQIRSYVMHPYSMVKDHRTNIETSNVNKVLDGDLDLFIESYLKGVR